MSNTVTAEATAAPATPSATPPAVPSATPSATPSAAPPDTQHCITQVLLPGDIVFDVGANVGDKAAGFLARGVQVVCIEPQPACVAILNSRYGGNANVAIVPKGLGSRVGILEMHINTRAPVLSTFSPEWMTGRFAHETWDEKLDIAVTTLDNMVREFGVPRYLKIDVEGFEYEVICGLSRRVGIVSFEFTDEFFSNSERLLKYLDNLGYQRFNFSLGEHRDFAMPQWVNRRDLTALLRNLFTRYQKVWGDIYAN